MELGYSDFSAADATADMLLGRATSKAERRQRYAYIATAAAGTVAALALIGFVAASPAVTTPTVATIMHDGIINAAEVKDDTIFDAAGRYIMKAYDRAKPMASFLPGVGGLWGVPMWAFYVNRGQGMATFGIENKEGGLLLFQTAEKSYQATANVGFRTLLKGTRKDGSFEAQPFFPESDADAAHTAARTMYIGNNEMEVEEVDPDTDMTTNALYFNIPNEDFPALVRRVTYTNTGDSAVDLEVVDGLAKLEPAGTTTAMLNAMGRTLEGWMHVYNFNTDHTAPFFHLVSAPADTADVVLIQDGHFAVAFVEDDSSLVSGKHELLPMICDQQLLFGTDTTLTVPRKFFASSESSTGASVADVIASPQSTTSRTPSAFAAASFKIPAGASKTISIVYGHAPDLDTFTKTIMPKLRAKGYVSSKLAEARSLAKTLTERVFMKSGVPLMDNYVSQNYLDNLLRGGYPIQIGNAPAPYTKIYHTFSRIHGDLERDYNNFMLEQSYWSQGPGNFRDVNQNRREDVKQLPAVHDYNVRNFLSFVAADGYNQLTVATSFFKIRDPVTIHDVAAKLAPPGPTNKAIVALLSKPFRPGTLFNDMKKAKIDLKMDRMELLELVTRYAEQVPAGSFSQNGFWTDHFTYYIDLVHDFLSIYPDEKEKLLLDADPIPFFLSPASVNPRVAKNMLVAEGKVRQYDSIGTSAAKGVELQKIFGSGDYVGDTTAGGQWQLTTAGTTMKVSILAKLIVLAANKFSILDPLGMGVEMEAGKPGWNDAMNGLPALFGSEMPSAYELAEIVDFVGESVDEIGRAVALPEEVSTLLTSIETEMAALAAGGADFDYWDKVHDALELYRKAVDATFTGKMVEWSAAKLGASSGLFGKMAAKCKAGAKRAATYAKDGVAPSYFQFKVTDYETLLNAHNGRGLPPVKVLAFEESPLPLFLEGPVRYLKTLKKASMDEKRAVYTAVAASTLHDTKLSMYKISENLGDMPMEVGRMKAFDSGWLENESIWLHMSYKWYLELLRAGLYTEFFKEIKKGVVCFMDTSVFGRSPLEATSFIVSSAFPDQALHGSGFLARLSGTTAEFLSMWNHMMLGRTPFTTDADGALQLSLEPVIADWMWRSDGMIDFRFLGAIDVTYVSETKAASWKSTIKSYTLVAADGTKTKVDGAVVPSPIAEDVRALKFASMTVTLG